MKTVTTANIITSIRGMINDNLKTNGRDSFIFDQDASFSLKKDYVSSSTIKVYKNGVLLTAVTDWTYSSDTNKVTISVSLTKNDDILIPFSYYDKYSDTELLAFLNVCLSKFVQKRYPKYFYIDDNNDVVTMDGINPTLEEANIMAVVTSINIDPNNVNIKTRDFSISAEENLSKSEQIDRVFCQWLRTFGSPEFLEAE